jgi:hypothetical protein
MERKFSIRKTLETFVVVKSEISRVDDCVGLGLGCWLVDDVKLPWVSLISKCPMPLRSLFSTRGGVTIGRLNGLFHVGDFFIRQEIEVARAIPCREPAIVLKAETNEKIDFPIWHVHDLLDRLFGLVIVTDV